MILRPWSAVRLAVLALSCALLPSSAQASLTALGEVRDSIRELSTALPRELPGPCEGELCGEREEPQPKTRVRGFELDLYCRLGGEGGLSCRPRRVWAEEYGERTSDQSLFTGHYFDTETQLYYAKARYFDPELGRFLSQDSYLGELTEPPSLHRYLYAADNPTRYVDPDGYDYVDPLERGCLPDRGCVPIGSNVTPMDVSDAAAWSLGSIARQATEVVNGAVAFMVLAMDEGAQNALGQKMIAKAPTVARAATGDYLAQAELVGPVIEGRRQAYEKGIDKYASAKSSFERGWSATETVFPEASIVAGWVVGLWRRAGTAQGASAAGESPGRLEASPGGAAAPNTGAPNRGLTWELEGGSQRVRPRVSAAEAFEDSLQGAHSDVASGRRRVPALRFDPPASLRGGTRNSHIRFDGVDPSDAQLLIDRKLSLVRFPTRNGPMIPQAARIRETLLALDQNPGFRVVYEFPDAAAARSARSILRELGVADPRLTVRVAQ